MTNKLKTGLSIQDSGVGHRDMARATKFGRTVCDTMATGPMMSITAMDGSYTQMAVTISVIGKITLSVGRVSWCELIRHHMRVPGSMTSSTGKAKRLGMMVALKVNTITDSGMVTVNSKCLTNRATKAPSATIKWKAMVSIAGLMEATTRVTLKKIRCMALACLSMEMDDVMRAALLQIKSKDMES